MAGLALIVITAGCGLPTPVRSENKQEKADAVLLRPICISDDGKLLAIADSSGSIKIWDWQSRRVITSIGTGKAAGNDLHQEPTEGSSSTGGRLASLRKRISTFLTITSKQGLSRVKGFFDQAAIESAFFDAAYDRQALTGAWIPFWKRSAFSPDNKYLALTGLDEVNLLDASDGSFAWRLGGAQREIAFSRDSKYMIAASNEAADLWDFQEARRLSTLARTWSYPSDSSIWPIGNGLYTAAFNSRGNSVAVADRLEVHGNYGSATTERVRIWDLSTILAVRPVGTETDWLKNVLPTSIDKTAPEPTVSRVLFPEPFPRHTGNPLPPEAPHLLMTYSPGDRYLAVATGDELRVWDLQEKAGLRTIGFRNNRPAAPQNVLGEVTSLGFSQNERLVAVGVGSRALVWDVLTGKVQYEFQADGNTWISVHFQPDGEIIATELPYASSTIRIWDVKTHALKAELP